MLHQAALAARGGVLVDHAFFRCLVQGTDRLHNLFTGFRLAGLDSFARIVVSCASGAADGAVAQTALLVLTVAFDL